MRVGSGIHTSRMPRSRACLQANDDIITPTQPITALSCPPPRVPHAGRRPSPPYRARRLACRASPLAASRARVPSRRGRALIRRARARAHGEIGGAVIYFFNMSEKLLFQFFGLHNVFLLSIMFDGALHLGHFLHSSSSM